MLDLFGYIRNGRPCHPPPESGPLADQAARQEGLAVSDREKIREHLARYVRATDHRDGGAMAEFFLPDGRVELFYFNDGDFEQIGTLIGHEEIAGAVANLMQPHPPRGWSHHTTHDPIITIDDDSATLDAQFIVFSVRGAERPAGCWPPNAFGAQGTVTPIESGYYRAVLRRLERRAETVNRGIPILSGL
jgi:hypothetical protein